MIDAESPTAQVVAIAKIIRGYHPAEILMALGVLGFLTLLLGGIGNDASARTAALAVSAGLVVCGALIRVVQDAFIALVARSMAGEIGKRDQDRFDTIVKLLQASRSPSSLADEK